MNPAILAAYFALSSWGSRCETPALLPTRHEWEAPYEKAIYAVDCDGELREVIVTSDWYGQRYGITYLRGSEWLRDMPDIENMLQ